MAQTPSARPNLTMIGRLERIARRDARDRATRERQTNRQKTILAPTSAAIALRTRVERLTACHRVALTGVDWMSAAARTEMPMPVRTHKRELKARKALTAYRPGFFDQIFGLEQGKRRILVTRVAMAASADEAEFQTARRVAETHNLEVHLTKRLLALDIPTLDKALPTRTRLAELGDLWEGVNLASPGRGWLTATVGGLALEDMPDETIFVTPEGQSLFKPLSALERHTLHREYVCALALRVMAELMTALPVEGVEVVVECDIPDGAGDYDRPRILIVKAPRQVFAPLKVDALEPLAVVAQLDGRMQWAPDTGFASLDTGATEEAEEPKVEGVAVEIADAGVAAQLAATEPLQSTAAGGVSPAVAAYRHAAAS